jgi:hypothetical protein
MFVLIESKLSDLAETLTTDAAWLIDMTAINLPID